MKNTHHGLHISKHGQRDEDRQNALCFHPIYISEQQNSDETPPADDLVFRSPREVRDVGKQV